MTLLSKLDAELQAMAAELNAAIDALQTDPNVVHMALLRGNIAKPTPAQMAHVYAGHLVTRDEMNAAVDAAVKAEREACARWHDVQSDAAMGNLHCGSENHEYRHARRTADLHSKCAAAIRARETTDGK